MSFKRAKTSLDNFDAMSGGVGDDHGSADKGSSVTGGVGDDHGSGAGIVEGDGGCAGGQGGSVLHLAAGPEYRPEYRLVLFLGEDGRYEYRPVYPEAQRMTIKELKLELKESSWCAVGTKSVPASSL